MTTAGCAWETPKKQLKGKASGRRRAAHDAGGRGAEFLCGGGGGEAGGGKAERNRGQAGTAARLAVGREVAGGCECKRAWNRAGAGAACRRVLVTAW